jgi:alpha-tubulin suppressor-like RCC1 family protein/CRISPR/Cas system-associated protein endoribonuclease Cas2
MSLRHSRLAPFLSAAALVLVTWTPRTVLAQGQVAIGQTVTSQITASNPVNAEGRRYALWTFVGAAGQSVRIDMASYELDSYLILQNANGTELARNDDGGGRLNAQITQTLPANGTYRILAVSFRTGGAMFGTYTLSVNAAGMAAAPVTPPPAQAPTAAVATPIAIGQTVTSQITASNPVNAEGRRYALWTFAGAAGQSVRIDMASYELDSYLILQNAIGTELARNDDGGGRLNAQITQTLPANGTYRILAVSFRTGGAMFGSYTLSVIAAGAAAAPVTPPPAQAPTAAVAMPIAIGQTVTSQITASSPVNAEGRRYALWTFVGAAGQSVRIDMASYELDSYLILQNANGAELARNDDGGGRLNAQITQTLPANGTYRILAVSFRTGGAMFGTYTLSANAAGAAATPVPQPPQAQPPTPAVAPPPPAPTMMAAPAGGAAGAPMRVATGQSHSCAIVGEGTVKCWGKNNYGQLGDGSTTNRFTPVPLNNGFMRPGLHIVEIVAGLNHTCGLTNEGRAWCWGLNDYGQLGGNAPRNTAPNPLPVAVAGAPVFTRIAAAERFTCGIADQTGVAYCWGRQFGATPVAVEGTRELAQLAAGGYHACGANSGGGAVCWGRGGEGQLGDGVVTGSTETERLQAAPVNGALGFRQLAAGGLHTCGVASDGHAYCWGQNRGQLGNGQSGSPIAAPVAVVGNLTFTHLAAGNQHTCGITNGGVAYCWGVNFYGQLGYYGQFGQQASSEISGFTPVPVAGGARFLQIASSLIHSCGTATNGTVWCWGRNDFGQAGNGPTTDRWAPPSQILMPN